MCLIYLLQRVFGSLGIARSLCSALWLTVAYGPFLFGSRPSASFAGPWRPIRSSTWRYFGVLAACLARVRMLIAQLLLGAEEDDCVTRAATTCPCDRLAPTTEDYCPADLRRTTPNLPFSRSLAFRQRLLLPLAVLRRRAARDRGSTRPSSVASPGHLVALLR